jgi:NTE family protein
MHHLHSLKNSGQIRGFAMPYLGQLDTALPRRPTALVPREKVINYPTNFAAMPDHWIEMLSDRGEQLTRALASYYLSDVLS